MCKLLKTIFTKTGKTIRCVGKNDSFILRIVRQPVIKPHTYLMAGQFYSRYSPQRKKGIYLQRESHDFVGDS